MYVAEGLLHYYIVLGLKLPNRLFTESLITKLTHNQLLYTLHVSFTYQRDIITIYVMHIIIKIDLIKPLITL